MSVTGIDRFFEPHWQVQYWDETTRTWLYDQHDYPTLEAASTAGPDVTIDHDALRWRLMEIAPGKRTPMEEHRIHSAIYTQDCEHCKAAIRWIATDLIDRRGSHCCSLSPTGDHEA